MNERIKQLMDLAELPLFDINGNCKYNDTYFDKEKFAELIVEECVQLALDEKQRYRNISHRDMSECAVAMDNYQLLLKEHFGVEE
jgi:hypothetical protein